MYTSTFVMTKIRIRTRKKDRCVWEKKGFPRESNPDLTDTLIRRRLTRSNTLTEHINHSTREPELTTTPFFCDMYSYEKRGLLTLVVALTRVPTRVRSIKHRRPRPRNTLEPRKAACLPYLLPSWTLYYLDSAALGVITMPPLGVWRNMRGTILKWRQVLMPFHCPNLTFLLQTFV